MKLKWEGKAALALSMLNLLYSRFLHCRHPGYTALNLTGVSVERLLLSFKKKVMGSVTLRALTVTTVTEASKLKKKKKRHRGEAPLYLDSDSELPVWGMLARHRRRTVFAEKKQSSGAAVTVLICVLFIYCICLYMGKNNNMKSLEHGVHLICDRGERVHRLHTSKYGL